MILAVFLAATTLKPAIAEAAEAKGGESLTVDSPPRTFTVDARVGPALLLESQSHALRYLVKPDLRLGARVTWRERWELGPAVDVLLDGSEHYRVLGMMGHVRFAAVQLSSFSLGLAGAIGAGYDADILHSSLQANDRVAPYYFVALDGRWQVGRWLFGIESAYQNAAIIQAGVLVGLRSD